MAEKKPAPRARRRVARALAAAVGLTAVGIAAGNVYAIRTAAAQTVATVSLAPNAPFAIVLGNLVFPDGGVSSDLHGRLALALELHRLRKVEKIYVSGAYRTEDAYDEPGVMARWLRARGVPEADIVYDRGGYRTAATMADAAAAGIHDAIVCTQAYHLPRALFLARRAGIHATGVPASERTPGFVDHLRTMVREGVARPESLLEVAVRGVRGHAEAVAGPKS